MGQSPVQITASALTMWLVGALFTITLALAGAWASYVTSAQDELKLAQAESEQSQASARERLKGVETQLDAIDKRVDQVNDTVNETARDVKKLLENQNRMIGAEERRRNGDTQ